MSKVGKRLAPSEKPKSPRKGRLSRQQIVLIVVVVVLALALAAVLALRSLFVRPELPKKNDPQKTETGDAQPDEPEGIDYGPGLRPRGGGGERKSENYWTVLIIGRDTGGGGLTDTLLLASYDVTNQKATVMSIPRDTMVNIPFDIKRINAVYNYYGGEEKGLQHLYKEIAQLVGFEPDFQVVVEWEAVGEIVDAMGGVYFDVPQDMNYDDPYQDLHIHQTAGYRLLTGDDAMQVLRYRHDNRKNGVMRGYPDGDLGRIKTQQAFLKSMVQQLLQLKNMTKIGPFLEVFQKNVETDMSFQNILWFAQQAVMGGLKMEDVNFVTMPNTGKYAYSRSVDKMTGGKQKTQSYVVPNARQLLDLVNNELSPFTEVFTMKDLDIMSVNADGSVSSSTGHVEDKQAALPPPKPEPEEEEPVVDENGNPINPETGEPIITNPETGEPVPAEPGEGESGGEGTPAGTEGNPAPSVPPSSGTAQPSTPETPSVPSGASPAPAPENPGTAPETPPAEPAQPSETPADPQPPADPGFTLIGPDPAA